MGSNEKCPGRAWRASRTPMDINRETVVQLYFQSSLSRETTIPRRSAREIIALPTISIFPVLSPIFAGTNGKEKAGGREQKKEEIKESLPTERRGQNIVGR